MHPSRGNAPSTLSISTQNDLFPEVIRIKADLTKFLRANPLLKVDQIVERALEDIESLEAQTVKGFLVKLDIISSALKVSTSPSAKALALLLETFCDSKRKEVVSDLSSPSDQPASETSGEASGIIAATFSKAVGFLNGK